MNETHHILTLGLTGNIGAGKTEAAKIFEHLGARVWYADSIAKTIMTSNDSVRKKIQTAFGKESYQNDGSLNRKFLANKVFSNKNELELLNSIVHPATVKHIQKEIEKEQSFKKYPLLLVEAALLFEAGINSMFDYVIVVRADESTCIERIKKRDRLFEADIQKRLRSQIDSKTKEAQADFVINNNGSLDILKDRCKFIFTLLLSLGKNIEQ